VGDLSVTVVVWRILQEAFNNIARHSKANVAFLHLRKTAQEIQVAIRDNGDGFDLMEALSVHSTRGGLGLYSMRERAELSGGTFVIESSTGAGTVIRASWPLQGA
jgi:signal transduction histidine kinase